VPRLDPFEVGLTAVLAALAAAALVAAFASDRRRRRRGTASLEAIDFVRTSFTSRMVRGDPIDALLREVVEALRSFLDLDAAEIWVLGSGMLRLQVADPSSAARALPISADLGPVLLNAPVSGVAWARTWIPELLAGRPDGVGLRLAPVSHAGEFLGLLVVGRARRSQRLAEEADELLEELARDVGIGLYRGGLDATLRATLEQLRRQAAELQASRARLVAAADAERKRIERDLHDGAQHYLLSVSVKARLVEKIAAAEPERAGRLLEELVQEVEAAVEELRALGHGIYPPLLSSSGLGDALAAACRRLSPPAELDAHGLGRLPAEVESAVYFCCVEALQNAAKHAGPQARTTVRLRLDENRLYFEVRDSGRGFEVSDTASGGLANMRDRLGATGGTLIIESRPGQGTVVRGEVQCSASGQGPGPRRRAKSEPG
jgi:signal transduction histidine kinase